MADTARAKRPGWFSICKRMMMELLALVGESLM
jgi:hypothetical protein